MQVSVGRFWEMNNGWGLEYDNYEIAIEFSKERSYRFYNFSVGGRRVGGESTFVELSDGFLRLESAMKIRSEIIPYI